jgi:hypothetical protein
MKTLLLATVAAAILAAPAFAQTMDRTDFPPAAPTPQVFAYECVIDKVTPSDRDDKDPSYKVNVLVEMTRITKVWHTLRSGKVVYRADQYDATSGPKRAGEDWSTSPMFWFGKHRKTPDLAMLGVIGSDDKKKMTYTETLWRGQDKKPLFTVTTICHEERA